MTRIAVSRRNVLEAGACALAGAAGLPGVASAHAWIGQSMTNEEIIRKYYAAWEKKEWTVFRRVVAKGTITGLSSTTGKVRMGRHFPLNFHICRWQADRVVNRFRRRNDAKNQGSASSMHMRRKRLHSFLS